MSCLSRRLLPSGAWAVAFLLLMTLAAAGAGGKMELVTTPGESYPGVFGPDAKLGYVLRQEAWNGSLPTGDKTPIRQQLFKNNDYRFYVWSDVQGAKVSLHVYDQDGNLVDGRAWERASGSTRFVGVDLKPDATGSYYLIVKVEQSPEKSTAWQMAYAYK